VPKREKSAVFWAIAIIWPLQNAHPCGAKLYGNSLISPKNGSDTIASPRSVVFGW
jgi:hypothetical protein